MIVSDRNGRIACIVALLLSILFLGSAVAGASGSSQQYGGTPHINASEAPAALTKAYPLKTGPPSIGPPSSTPPRKTRAAPGTTLAPSSTNLFWLFWLALGGGLALILFLFWLELGGWQALRLIQRPTERTDEDSAKVPAPPATGRTKIVGSGQSAPYTPRFGTEVPGGSSRVGHERRASDDRQDREIEELDSSQRSSTRHTS
jgi:hypothetical protein